MTANAQHHAVSAGLAGVASQPALPEIAYRLAGVVSPIDGPHSPLHNGAFVGEPVAASPDPLIRYRWPEVRPTDDLQTYVLAPVTVSGCPAASFADGCSAASGHGPIPVSGPGSLRFDFGIESAGWLEFDSADLSGLVEMSVSEYNEPEIVNVLPEHRIKTLAPVRHGDTWRLELNKELFEGVRFGWIHVRTFEQPWRINAVRLVCQTKPVNYDGSFSCSDPLLTRIWYTGAYGVRINLLKDYFAALPLDRGDRFSWTGDAHPAQAAALVAFDQHAFVRANIERTADDANGIETYALCWILSVVDYFRSTGDTGTLITFADNIRAKLEHGNAIFEAPHIGFCGWDERLGAGFTDPNRPETRNLYRMLFIRACRAFARAMGDAGDGATRDAWLELAARREREFRRHPDWAASHGLHALADLINADVALEADERRIFSAMFRDRVNRLSFSPFNGYFVIQALARLGWHDIALACIRDHWGGQIAFGGTTFFETFRPEWNALLAPNDAPPNGQSGYTSLAHAWGGGVVAWLTREVLGVVPAAPGYSRIAIKPHLGRTLTRVAGAVSTPHGAVAFALDVTAGTGEVIVPDGCVANVCLPFEGRRIASVRIADAVVWDGQSYAFAGVGRIAATAEGIELTDVRPGRYPLAIAYAGDAQQFEDAAWRYAANFTGSDSATGGDWGGVYGRDGYALFAYDDASHDRLTLPDGVASLTLSPNCQRVSIQAPADDRRVPAPGRDNGWPRRLGAVLTTNPKWDGVTLTVDVALRPGARHRISLYFLDWEALGRRQVVEVFDLATCDLLAPPQLVRDFHAGRYLSLTCDRSVRFRINHVRGDNAVINGLFFDPVET